MGNYVDNHLVREWLVEYETEYHWIIVVSLEAIFTLFILPTIKFFTSEFAFTNNRVIIKTGLISMKTVEKNLQKIESVNVNQSILGRLFGYGDLVIVGTGGTREVFTQIKKPIKFRKRFQELSLA